MWNLGGEIKHTGKNSYTRNTMAGKLPAVLSDSPGICVNVYLHMKRPVLPLRGSYSFKSGVT